MKERERAGRRAARRVIAGLAIVLAAAGWLLAVWWTLEKDERGEARARIAAGRRLLEAQRDLARAELRALARVLADDPRLKATLATPGIDDETVSDILRDLRRLSGKDLIVVLTPEGAVMSVAGAESLRGADLSGSTLFRAVSATAEAQGVWMIGDELVDVGAVAVRYEQNAVAYLVLGGAVTKELLGHIHSATGIGAALVWNGRVQLHAPADAGWRVAHEQLAAYPDELEDERIDLGEASYLGALREIGDAAVLPRPRFALLAPLRASHSSFSMLAALLLLPPVVAFLLALYVAARGEKTEATS